MKHTEGPWNAEEMGSEGWTVFSNNLRLPRLLILATNLSEPDALLIAAAPELLVGLRESNAQLIHLRDWLASDLSALNRRDLIEAVDRIASDALAALPENLK